MSSKKPRDAVLQLDVTEFLREIRDVERTEATKDFIRAEELERLVVLAKISNAKSFGHGIRWAVIIAAYESQFFSVPVYQGQFIKRLEEMRQAALLLERQIESIMNPEDHVTLLVQNSLFGIHDALGRGESAESYLTHLKTLASMLGPRIAIAKHYASKFVSVKKGRPRGAGGSGIAMDRFIARLEFVARAAGGGWTLSKNDESGTLVDALDILRGYLPVNFVPAKHPYSTYQSVLNRARHDWKSATTRKGTRKAVR